MSAALLLLADGRLPAGGHVHSGGIEAAVEAGTVSDTATLGRFLEGRLRTVGLTAAALAAAACEAVAAGALGRLQVLDATADARTPSPAQRAASRTQGRALVRLARRAWPSPAYDALGAAPHHAIALGTCAAAAEVGPAGAALAAATAAVSGPASAAIRLLGLDPFTVAALQAQLAVTVDEVAAVAVSEPGRCPTAPLLDALAETHAQTDTPLFAS